MECNLSIGESTVKDFLKIINIHHRTDIDEIKAKLKKTSHIDWHELIAELNLGNLNPIKKTLASLSISNRIWTKAKETKRRKGTRIQRNGWQNKSKGTRNEKWDGRKNQQEMNEIIKSIEDEYQLTAKKEQKSLESHQNKSSRISCWKDQESINAFTS